MKTFIRFISILLSVSVTRFAHGDFTGQGHVHTHSETKQVFANPDCRSTDTCDLKKFTLTKLVNEIWFSDNPDHPTHGNGVIMEYETDSVAALEKYVIVQFKKGCVFEFSKNRQGKTQTTLGDSVASFGENITFCFRRWVIDSQDTDPAYNSDPVHGRFYLLRWNSPGSYDNRTQKYYGVEKPKKPVVYMADYPAGAFVSETGVRNVALEFSTCIYKASDVPVTTRRDDLYFAKPIACFEWQNIYVYDFSSSTFRTALADVPAWDNPSTPANVFSLTVIVTLFTTLVLIIFALLKMFRR